MVVGLEWVAIMQKSMQNLRAERRLLYTELRSIESVLERRLDLD